MFQRIIIIFISLSILTSCNHGSNQNMGTIMGGVTGAVLGSQFGKGTGMIVGTAIGTMAGAMIGGSIGQQMDEHDKVNHYRTSQIALENAPDGGVMAWQNPNNGHKGKIIPMKTYQLSDHGKNVYCREYQQTVDINGQKQKAYGKACRQPDGSWKIVE